MISLLNNRSFLLEETDRKVSLIIYKVDKHTATSSLILHKEMSIPLALIFAFLLAIIFLIALPLLTLIVTVNLLKDKLYKSKAEPSYEQACQWFEQKQGFYQNLSKEERKKIFTRKKDLPLGL